MNKNEEELEIQKMQDGIDKTWEVLHLLDPNALAEIKSINIGTTYWNKVMELKREFKEKGIQFFSASAVSSAIRYNLKNYYIEAMNALGGYFETFKDQKTVFGKIIQKPELQETRKRQLSEYSRADNKVFKYNLREHVVDSIVGYMKVIKFPEMLDDMKEELKKLGFENIIPELDEKMKDEKTH